MWKLLTPPAYKAEQTGPEADAKYKKLRWQVFLGIFIGYAGFYIVRKNFSMAIPMLADFGFEKEYNPGLAYNNSKLYTIWMTRYLARDFFLKGSNITINAYHPGLISTNLGNNSSDEKTKKSLFGRLMKSLSKDLDQGIETGYYLTLSEEVRGLTGYYFDEKKVKSVSEKGYTIEKARKLMDYCQEKIKLFKEKQDF